VIIFGPPVGRGGLFRSEEGLGETIWQGKRALRPGENGFHPVHPGALWVLRERARFHQARESLTSEMAVPIVPNPNLDLMRTDV